MLNSEKLLLFVGDHHGDWDRLFTVINNTKIENCYLISVGDSGIGFKPKKAQLEEITRLNNKFKKLNIVFMAIRGNHDDPFYFTGDNKIDLSNFKLIEDYTVMEHNGKSIQFIGGATSIDRSMRKEGVSYWKDEGLQFNKDKLQKVDTLVTHITTSWCFPRGFNQMVYDWAKDDGYLLEELTLEREVMGEIFKVCQPSLHLYGHFHDSWNEEINGCKHRMLNINEIWGEY